MHAASRAFNLIGVTRLFVFERVLAISIKIVSTGKLMYASSYFLSLSPPLSISLFFLRRYKFLENEKKKKEQDSRVSVKFIFVRVVFVIFFPLFFFFFSFSTVTLLIHKIEQ